MKAAPLWRDRSFRLLWTGQVATITGGQVRLVVLPVLLFQLTGSAARTALLLTVLAAPYLLLGLLAGAFADRSNRRVVMVVSDSISAAAMASIPVAGLVGDVTVAHIYLVAAITGTTFVFYDSALFGALPAIVGRDRVAAGYGILISTSSVLQVGATAVAGVLIAVVGPENALWIDAVGYLVGALMVLLIPQSLSAARADGPRSRIRADIVEGLRFVRHHPVVGPLTLSGLGSGLTAGAVSGLVVVYGVRQLDLAEDDALLGWLYTALAVGGVIAGSSLPVLARRWSPPRLTFASLLAMIVVLGGLAASSHVVPSLVLLVAWGAVSVLVIANGITLRQRLTPDRLQGRVNVSARMIAASGTPVGAAAGGVLADALNVRSAMLIMAVGVVASTAYLALSPLRTMTRETIDRLEASAAQAS